MGLPSAEMVRKKKRSSSIALFILLAFAAVLIGWSIVAPPYEILHSRFSAIKGRPARFWRVVSGTTIESYWIYPAPSETNFDPVMQASYNDAKTFIAHGGLAQLAPTGMGDGIGPV